MGAFCIFGISRTVCKINASKNTPSRDPITKLDSSPVDWAARRDALANTMFDEATRRVKISPEFDAPQFCQDWLSIDPSHVRDTVIMVRGPKIDKHGDEVKKNGATVETWREYSAECVRLGIIPAALDAEQDTEVA